MPRPFRVPGGMLGAVLAGVGPAALLVFALIRNRSEQIELGRFGTISTLTLGLGLMALGVVYYFVAGRPKAMVAEVVSGDLVFGVWLLVFGLGISSRAERGKLFTSRARAREPYHHKRMASRVAEL